MTDCIFCKIVAGELECSEVYADDEFLAFMDIHPVGPGHVLIVPRRHAQYVAELPHGAAERLFGLGTRIAEAIRHSELPCDALHFLLNDGRAANQTVPHAHLHLIPRRRGDGGRVLTQILKRPLVGLLRPTPRADLDADAKAIMAKLEAPG